ncbi:Protein of unknown function [Bacillus cytotoxicus]|nr:Protein of unknown function [Bacillus cytotoxicus]
MNVNELETLLPHLQLS